MATTKPGEIRCPTCHRSTPPAAFCTQCGAPIPSDARIRPRGLDRDELEERIRMRRSGDDPWRRGAPAAGAGGAPSAYERFQPEPQDAAARRDEPEPEQRVDHFDEEAAAAAAAAAAPPPSSVPSDVTRDVEPEPWQRFGAPPVVGSPPPEPVAEPTAGPAAPPPAWPSEGSPQAFAERRDDEPYAGPYAESYDASADDEWGRERSAYAEAWDEEPRRRSGVAAGGLAILAFLALGVLALLGGAVLAGFFGNRGIGQTDASPTPAVTVVPTSEASVAPTPATSASVVPSGSAPATGGPVTFPDGFVGDVEPCATEAMDFAPNACEVDGSVITSDRMWAWIGFEKARGSDVLVLSLQVAGQTIDQQEFLMSETVRCPDTCTGFLRQGYTNLNPGDYELLLERDGEFADRTSFTVEG
jgi:hypothetical protein